VQVWWWHGSAAPAAAPFLCVWKSDSGQVMYRRQRRRSATYVEPHGNETIADDGVQAGAFDAGVPPPSVHAA